MIGWSERAVRPLDGDFRKLIVRGVTSGVDCLAYRETNGANRADLARDEPHKYRKDNHHSPTQGHGDSWVTVGTDEGHLQGPQRNHTVADGVYPHDSTPELIGH